MSCSSITPSTFSFCDTTNGVPPLDAMVFTLSSTPSGNGLPALSTIFLIESNAPLRTRKPSGVSNPLERVSAVNLINTESLGALIDGMFLLCSASSTIDFPSGVSSANDASTQAVTRSSGETPGAGQNWVALRLPIVIVPVLSNNKVSKSPAVSTALPDLVITLARNALSIPAIPMADNRPPIVVGIRQTNKEINAAIVIGVLA